MAFYVVKGLKIEVSFVMVDASDLKTAVYKARLMNKDIKKKVVQWGLGSDKTGMRSWFKDANGDTEWSLPNHVRTSIRFFLTKLLKEENSNE